MGVMGVLEGKGEVWWVPEGGVGGMGGRVIAPTLVLMGLRLLILRAWLVWAGMVTGGGCWTWAGWAKCCGGGIGETGEKGRVRGPLWDGDMGETGAFSLLFGYDDGDA